MRGHVAGVVALLFILPTAWASSASIHGELEYELDAAVHGRVSAGPGSILTSLAKDDAAPSLARFHLQAGAIEATFHRSYVQAATRPLPLAAGRSSDIDTTGEKTEKRTYRAADLALFATTSLWNVVAVAPTNASAEVGLPTSDYSLANADPNARLLRPDVPVPRSFSKELDAPRAIVRDGLVLTSSDLSATVQGDFLLALYGGTFDLTSPTTSERIVTGRYDELATRDDVPLPEPRAVNATAFLRVKDGLLTLTAGDDLLSLHARTVHVQGSIDFQRVSGTFDVGGRSQATVPRTITGDLELTSRGKPYKDAQGDRFGLVRLQGTTSIQTTPATLPILAAAAVVAAALGSLAAAVRWIPASQRLAFGALALFSMVKKDEALGTKNRGQLYDYVRSNPGTNLSDVQRVLGLGWGTTLYHVSVLERLDMVVTRRVGGRRLLFINGASRLVDPAAWSALQNPAVRRLATDLLVPGRRLTQADVARMLDFSPQYAGRLLRRLEGVGLVVAATESARLCYAATPLMVDLAQRAAIVPAPVGGLAVDAAAALNV